MRGNCPEYSSFSILIEENIYTEPGNISKLAGKIYLFIFFKPLFLIVIHDIIDQVMDVIDHSALIVVPSRFDSFSYVAAEALARGRPVLISEKVGIGQWIDGLPTVPVGEVGALAEAQIEMLRKQEQARAALPGFMRQLNWECSGEAVLPGYEHFVRSLNPEEFPDDDQPDAVDLMRAYLGEIERAERRMGLLVEDGNGSAMRRAAPRPLPGEIILQERTG